MGTGLLSMVSRKWDMYRLSLATFSLLGREYRERMEVIRDLWNQTLGRIDRLVQWEES